MADSLLKEPHAGSIGFLLSRRRWFLPTRRLRHGRKAHMTKKHILLAPVCVLIFLFCCAGGIAAFQCDNKFISEGSFRDEVLGRCGPPSMSDTWQEERPVGVYIRDNGQLGALRSVLVTIDRWTYNFGPYQFMQTLTFENAKLIKIEQGKYGY
jgi:hypothetical protein